MNPFVDIFLGFLVSFFFFVPIPLAIVRLLQSYNFRLSSGIIMAIILLNNLVFLYLLLISTLFFFERVIVDALPVFIWGIITHQIILSGADKRIFKAVEKPVFNNKTPPSLIADMNAVSEGIEINKTKKAKSDSEVTVPKAPKIKIKIKKRGS